MNLGNSVVVIDFYYTDLFCRDLVHVLLELESSDKGNLPRANLSSARKAGCLTLTLSLTLNLRPYGVLLAIITR